MKYYFNVVKKIWILLPAVFKWITIGSMLGIGFVYPMFWWLVIFGIILFLHTTLNTKKIQQAIGGGFVAWSIKSLFAISFFWNALPLEWLNISNWWQEFGLVLFGWLWSGFSLGVGGALVAGILFCINKYRWFSNIFLIIPISFSWLLGEYFSSLFYSVTTSGPGSFIQGYFSFGYVGYLLGITKLGLFFASLGGVYLLTLLLVSFCAGLLSLSDKKNFKSMIFLLGVFLVALFSANIIFPNDLNHEKKVVVNVINTSFGPRSLDSLEALNFRKTALSQAVEASLKLNPDYLLLPEDSRFLISLYPSASLNQSLTKFKFQHSDSKTMLIDSMRIELSKNQAVVRAELFSGQYNVPTYYFDKQYLVPSGEYIPYIFILLLKITGFSELLSTQEVVGNYQPGPLLQSDKVGDNIPGILFCFESIRPGGVRFLKKNKSIPFVAHPISHASFHNPKILWQQLDVMLQIQARFQGIPIVSAGNMVSGKLYLPNGQIDNGRLVANGAGWNIIRFEF